MLNHSRAIRAGVALVVAVISLVGAGGCTSVIGSAYLREAWVDAVEQAADRKAAAERESPAAAADANGPTGAPVAGDTDDASGGLPRTTAGSEPAAASPAWAPETIEEALAEADDRLAPTGGLAEAARTALVATLEATPRQDWPVVVEEFTTALVAAQADAGPRRRSTPAALRVSSEKDADERLPAAPTTPPVEPAEPLAPLPPAEQSVEQPAAQPVQEAAAMTSPQPPPVDEPPEFAVRNACFASRVRGWGVVDRFETTQFAAGQDVIVYFELEALSAQASSAGHMTRVDTTLALVGGDGTPIERWSFEPLEEICPSRRRDYFARYLITLPATLPTGSCHLEIRVRDGVADRVSQASVPLEIVSR